MKKTVSLLLAILLLAGLASGCKRDGGGSAGSVQEAEAFYKLAPDDLVAEALRRFDALDSWSYTYDTALDYELFDEGPKTVLKSSGEFNKQPMTMHGHFSSRPEEEETPLEYYIQEKDYPVNTVLQIARHAYARVNNQSEEKEWKWAYGKKDKRDPSDPNLSLIGEVPSARWGKGLVYPYDGVVGTELLSIADNIWRFLSAGSNFRREDRETVNGRPAVRFSGTVSGEALFHLLEYACCPNYQFAMQEEDAAIQAGIPITIWIDAEQVLPLRIRIDVDELMEQELSDPSFREQSARQLSSMPGAALTYEEMLDRWDEQVRFGHGSVTIDLDPEPCEIVIPEDIAQHMEQGF